MNTMQQEFDAVVQHLYTQGEGAASHERGFASCWYRQPGSTNKCAVGCRIPDDKYDPGMDKEDGDQGTSVDSLVRRFSPVLPPEIVAYERMFAQLQYAHDSQGSGKFNFDRLATDLSGIATTFELTFTEPKRPE